MTSRTPAAKRRIATSRADASLLDIVDHVLTKGIVLTGDLVLGVADVDLIYLRVSALLCAFDRIAGPSHAKSRRRRSEATKDLAHPLGRRAARAHRRRAP